VGTGVWIIAHECECANAKRPSALARGQRCSEAARDQATPY
jgi:hypothetical protein